MNHVLPQEVLTIHDLVLRRYGVGPCKRPDLEEVADKAASDQPTASELARIPQILLHELTFPFRKKRLGKGRCRVRFVSEFDYLRV